MRFRHLTEESLDNTVKKVEKADEKTVAKAQLLHSKAWQDHVSEHHGAGPKAQLVSVDTTEDSELLQKTEDKKKDEKEEAPKQQHTAEHGQTSANARTGYLSSGSGTTQRGPGDAYFGTGSARLKEISGQCSCGAEISTGWQPEQAKEPRLTGGYVNPSEREREEKEQQQPLYTTSAGSPGNFQQQERSLYSTGQSTPGLSTSQDQRRRRTSAL